MNLQQLKTLLKRMIATEGYVLGLESDDIVGVVGGAAPADFIQVSDRKAANTPGGTFTLGAWRTRDINTEDADTGGHASIATNQITLAAGTYEFDIMAMAFRCNAHILRLQNITDAVTIDTGTTHRTDASTVDENHPAFVKGRFTIAAQKTFEVQHYSSGTRSTDGFGKEANVGVQETYLLAEFRKVG